MVFALVVIPSHRMSSLGQVYHELKDPVLPVSLKVRIRSSQSYKVVMSYLAIDGDPYFKRLPKT